jgi:hypothetical protein
VLPLIPERRHAWIQSLVLFAVVGLTGIGIFYLLKVSPLFPFLFNRAGDFSFSVHDFWQGAWQTSINNGINFARFSWYYLTVPFLLILVIGAIYGKQSNRRNVIPLLLLMSLTYALPFVVLGKIVYSRYYLPVVVFLIPAAAMGWENLIHSRYRLVAYLLGSLFFAQAVWFSLPWYTDVSLAHLPKEDIEQYLTTWSAGFGTIEVRDYVAREALDHPVVVATEGYFGSLPDGLVMYFDKLPLPPHHMDIFGIGQPINSLPLSVIDKAKTVDTYIVVNQDRLNLDPRSCCITIGTYPRPLGGASLLLLKYKPGN